MIYTLFIILVILQITDWWTTHRGLSSGKEKEVGPLMKWAIPKFGLNLSLVIKGLGVIILGLILVLFAPAAFAIILLAVWVAIYVAIIISNLFNLRKAGLL
jgi:hypothetical protein